MKTIQVWLRALVLIGLALTLSVSVATAQEPPGPPVELQLVGKVLSSGGPLIDQIDALEVLDDNPNEIVFTTQQIGAYCGGGTPADVWKMAPDPSTGMMTAVKKGTMSLIQNVRGALLESSDGTLLTGGGWCDYKPPYFSMDSGETWQPANKGTHPPYSSFSLAEFNGHAYLAAGAGWYRGEIYRWLGDAGDNHWELVAHFPTDRDILYTLAVYDNQLFVGTVRRATAGCSRGPVYVSSDGETYNMTTGINDCESVNKLLVVGDQLIARAYVSGSADTVLYRWDKDNTLWVRIGAYNLGGKAMVSVGDTIYAAGKAPSDRSPGIYQSTNLGKSWQQIAVIDNPTVSAMSVHGDTVYLSTYRDSEYAAYIYRLVTTMSVAIDIKPGNDLNDINPGSYGKITVAILSAADSEAADFDAPGSVDRDSLTFGHNGDEASLDRRGGDDVANCGVEDINADGLQDLVCHFDTQAANFQAGDTEGTLMGQTLDGMPILGQDSVTIVP